MKKVFYSIFFLMLAVYGEVLDSFSSTKYEVACGYDDSLNNTIIHVSLHPSSYEENWFDLLPDSEEDDNQKWTTDTVTGVISKNFHVEIFVPGLVPNPPHNRKGYGKNCRYKKIIFYAIRNEYGELIDISMEMMLLNEDVPCRQVDHERED